VAALWAVWDCPNKNAPAVTGRGDLDFSGAPSKTRTCDLQVRKLRKHRRRTPTCTRSAERGGKDRHRHAPKTAPDVHWQTRAPVALLTALIPREEERDGSDVHDQPAVRRSGWHVQVSRPSEPRVFARQRPCVSTEGPVNRFTACVVPAALDWNSTRAAVSRMQGGRVRRRGSGQS